MNENDRAIVGLVMLAHALVHTYELSVPILVSIWLVEFPVTEAELGLVVTVGTALFGLGALPSGLMTDRFGSRRLIAVCLAGMGVSFLLLGVAPSVTGITVALVVWGSAASLYHPAGLSLISTGVSERGRGLALHGAAGNVGIAFGPLVTTLLLIPFGWRTVVELLGALALLAVPLAVVADIDERAAVELADGGEVPDETESEGDTPDRSGSEGDTQGEPESDADADSLGDLPANTRRLFAAGFAGVFVVVLFSGLYYRGMLTFLPELLGGFDAFDPVELAGRELQPARYLYAGLLTVGVAGQYVGGRASDRVDTGTGLAVAFGALALTTLAFVPAASAGLVPLLIVSALLGFTLFTVQPLYQATVAETTPPALRGLSYGYMYLGVFGVGALGATVAGRLLTFRSRTALFLVFAGFAAAAATLSLRLRGR